MSQTSQTSAAVSFALADSHSGATVSSSCGTTVGGCFGNSVNTLAGDAAEGTRLARVLPGESGVSAGAGNSSDVTVTFSLSGLDLSVWDATAHKWSEVKGTFKVAVGASSRDLKLKGTMDKATVKTTSNWEIYN